MNPTQLLLNKYAKFEWTNEGREYFRCIEVPITRSPFFASPDYSKYFLFFSFSFESTIMRVFDTEKQRRI